jgi:hypothetical protein
VFILKSHLKKKATGKQGFFLIEREREKERERERERLTMYLRLASNLKASCLSSLSAGIIGTLPHLEYYYFLATLGFELRT